MQGFDGGTDTDNKNVDGYGLRRELLRMERLTHFHYHAQSLLQGRTRCLQDTSKEDTFQHLQHHSEGVERSHGGMPRSHYSQSGVEKGSAAHRPKTADNEGEQLPVLQYFSWHCLMCRLWEVHAVRYEKVGRMDKDRRTGKEREPIDKAYYICQTYNRLGKNACTSHRIEARNLYNLVIADIQEVTAMALKDREAFYVRLSRKIEKQYLADTDSLKR